MDRNHSNDFPRENISYFQVSKGDLYTSQSVNTNIFNIMVYVFLCVHNHKNINITRSFEAIKTLSSRQNSRFRNFH